MSVYTIYANQIMYIHNKEKILVLMLLIGGVINGIFKVVLFNMQMLTPLSAIVTTIISETILLIMLRQYIKKNLSVEFNIFAIKNMKYLYLSIIFVPIVYGIKLLDLGVIWNCVISIPICMGLYFGILLLTKDDIFMLYVNKVKSKLLKK